MQKNLYPNLKPTTGSLTKSCILLFSAVALTFMFQSCSIDETEFQSKPKTIEESLLQRQDSIRVIVTDTIPPSNTTNNTGGIDPPVPGSTLPPPPVKP